MKKEDVYFIILKPLQGNVNTLTTWPLEVTLHLPLQEHLHLVI